MVPDPVNPHSLQARRVAGARATGEAVSIADLPAGGSLIRILGVDYVHLVDETAGDLYLTTVGYRYAEHLRPECWYEPAWFRAKRRRLLGTALVYAVPTKPVRGESLDLVVKYSRVGERVPIDTALVEQLLCCEFNGPFEEFALLEELRHSRRGPAHLQVHTQLPLAIYVPPDEIQPAQVGRFAWRIARKVDQHPGVAIDLLRQYLLVYRWIPGVDAWEAHGMGLLTEDEARTLNTRATAALDAKGFRVLDMKPQHVIVEPSPDGGLAVEGDAIRYGVVDYELMERTGEYWRELQAEQGRIYQRRRSELLANDGVVVGPAAPLPENLVAVTMLGVDYVHGRVESTGGLLWVVGHAPDLFDFYRPERWRTTPQIRLQERGDTFFTTSKDDVALVWKVSRVGEPPSAAAWGVEGFRVLAYGFNSPFEEVAIAWHLLRRGLPVILPRAIYRTGHHSELDESLFDPSRYTSHAEWRAIDGDPVLVPRRNYITLWDYWGGPDAPGDGEGTPVARSLNVTQALERGLLDEAEARALLATFRTRIEGAGFEVLRLLPEHLLLSIGAAGEAERDEDGAHRACLCNFQLLRPGDAEDPRPGAPRWWSR